MSGGGKLTLLRAAQVLALRRETLGLDAPDAAELSVRLYAALVAQSFRRGGRQVYADGDAVLGAMSLGRLRRLRAEYESLDDGAELEALFAVPARESAQSEASVQSAQRNASFDEARFLRLRAGASYTQTPGERATSPSPGTAAAAGRESSATAEPQDARRVSAAMERDARRYDGGFELF